MAAIELATLSLSQALPPIFPHPFAFLLVHAHEVDRLPCAEAVHAVVCDQWPGCDCAVVCSHDGLSIRRVQATRNTNPVPRRGHPDLDRYELAVSLSVPIDHVLLAARIDELVAEHERRVSVANNERRRQAVPPRFSYWQYLSCETLVVTVCVLTMLFLFAVSVVTMVKLYFRIDPAWQAARHYQPTQ